MGFLKDYLFIIFIGAILLQMIYFWLITSKVAFLKTKHSEKNIYDPISVVITVRNEQDNLMRFLKFVLEQDYPNFEVIVVNDQSNDDSEYYLKSLQPIYLNLKIVNVLNPVNFFKGKKFPLSIGIKSAKNDLIVLIDADCKPNSNQWLKEIAESYEDGTKIVLGFGDYSFEKGFLNYVIRYETLKTAINYFSFARIGIPYMGVGRNLSYKKSLFFEQHGFQSHYKIQSGDDDLFVNKAANRLNTRILASPTSKTISLPETSFLNFVNQKRRHLTSGKYYKAKHLFLLFIFDISYYLFLITAILLLLEKQQIIAVTTLIALRYISFLIITKLTMIKLGVSKLLLISPFLELLLSVFIQFILMTNIIYRNAKWK